MKFNKIFSFLAVGMMSLGFAACSDSEPEYTQGASANKDGVYFSSVEGNSIDLTLNQSMIEVNLYREKTDDDLDVTLTASSMPELPAGTFNVPTTVHFAKGADMAVVNIPIVFDNFEPNKEYALTLSVGTEDSTPYGMPSKTFTVVYAPWTSWKLLGTGIWTNTQFFSGNDECPVYRRQSSVDPNIYQYRCGNVGDPNIPEDDQYGMAYGVNYIFTYDASTGEITFEPTNTGVLNTNYNEYVYCAGMYEYAKDIFPGFLEKCGMTLDELRTYSTFDTETGLFSIGMVYYVSLGWFGYGYEYLQLPGYTNYKVQVETNGHYVDEKGTETQVLSIFMPESISEARYQIYSGSLTEDEAEAKARTLSDDENAKTLDASGNVAVELTEGKYTVVVAGYDEGGTYRSFAYLVFDFTSVKSDPNAGWTSLGKVYYIDDIVCSLFMETYQAVAYEVELQQNDENPGKIRLVNPYGDGVWPFFSQLGYLSNGKTNYLNVNMEDTKGCYVERSPLNFVYKGNDWEISSMAQEYLLNGSATLAQLKAAGYLGEINAEGVMKMPSSVVENGQSYQLGPIILEGDGSYRGNTNGAFAIDMSSVVGGANTTSVAKVAQHRATLAKAKRTVNAKKTAISRAYNTKVLSKNALTGRRISTNSISIK